MLRRPLVALSVAFALLLGVPAASSAATVTWDGDTNMVWGVGSNWDGDVVPTTGDTAVIPAGATVMVTSSTAVDAVELAGTLVVSNAVVLDVANPNTAAYDIVATGSGAVSLQSSNTALASSNDDVVRVSMATGSFTALTGSEVVGPTVDQLVIDSAGQVNLNGTIDLPDELDALDIDASVLRVNDGQLLSDASPPTLTVAEGTTLRHDGSSNRIFSIPVQMLDGANVEVLAGSSSAVTSFQSGIDFLGASDITFTGTAGANVELGGTGSENLVQGALAVTGSGTVRLTSNATLALGTNTLSLGADSTLRAQYGTNGARIDADAGSLIDGAGTLTWDSDPFVSGAEVTTGSSTQVVSATTTNFDGSSLTVDGTWTATQGNYYGASGLTVGGTGTLRNTSPATTPLINTPLDVQGTLELSDDADLQYQNLADMTDYSTANGGTLTGGTWVLGAGSRIIQGSFAGLARLVDADVTLGPGALFAGGGFADQLPGHAITLSGSELRFAGGSTGFATRSFTAGTSFDVQSGTLAVGGGDGLEVNAFGAVTIGAAGSLEVATDSSLSSSAITSTGRIAGGGTITGTTFAINGGSVEPGTTGASDAVGALTLAGPVAFNDGVLEAQVTGPNFGDSDRVSLQGNSARTFAEDFAIEVDTTGFADPAYSFERSLVTLDSDPSGTFSGTPGLSASPALTAPKQYRVDATATTIDLRVTEQGAPADVTGSVTSHTPGTASSALQIDVVLDPVSDDSNGSGIDGFQVVTTQVATEPVVPVDVDEDDGTFTALATSDGTWYVFVRAVDNRGNASASWTRLGPFVIDTVAPAAPVLGGAPSGSTTETTASITITGEGGSTVRCSLDGAAFTACTSPVALTGLAVGAHTLRATLTDAAGNVSAPGSVSWTIVAPTPTNPQPPATPPVKPSPAKVVFVGAQPKFAAIGRTGQLKLTLPVTEAGVKVTMRLQVNRAQAAALGLTLPRRATSLVIGTGTATSTKSGPLAITVRLTAPAKAAFARLAKPRSKATTARATLAVSLAKSGLTSSLVKPLTFRK
jgi:hypothetical protein